LARFVSATRYYLDRFLSEVPFSGRVLDMGGKKEKRRGSFCPPLDKVASWEYVNTDPATSPDHLCSAESVPVRDASYDWVVMTEVLEHVAEPAAVLKECFRLLKPSGTLVASMPFLYPVHADPHDFQRWTPVKIRREFEKAGFQVQEISPRGGIVAVMLDLVNVYNDAPELTWGMKIFRPIFVIIAPAILFFDRWTRYKNELTTGYLIRAVKP
jgi:SAM-dependent methyltransferase